MLPNIDLKGRIARAIFGIVMVAIAIAAWVTQWPASSTVRWIAMGVLVAIGLFQFYEAKKGWCLARACGIRTPM